MVTIMLTMILSFKIIITTVFFIFFVRDLSEISRGGGGVKTEGGSQLFEPEKREGS